MSTPAEKSLNFVPCDRSHRDKRRLTEVEKSLIVKNHRSDPSLNQKALALWATDQFGLGYLAQNTISAILTSAKKDVQTGKITHAQRREILEHHHEKPQTDQSKLRLKKDSIYPNVRHNQRYPQLSTRSFSL